jgi:uncharacterized membrane protein HdeD (DUF308 family)
MKSKSSSTFFFRGFVLIVLGFMAMLYTDEALKSLTLIPGLVVTVVGLVQTIFAYMVRKKLPQWQWYLAGGLAVLAIGIVLLLNPEMTIKVLFIGFGAWFIFQAIYDFIAMNFWRKTEHPNWWQLGLLAVVEVVLGIALITDPLGSAMKVTVFIGGCLVLGGIATLVVGYYLREKRHRKPATDQSE